VFKRKELTRRCLDVIHRRLAIGFLDVTSVLSNDDFVREADDPALYVQGVAAFHSHLHEDVFGAVGGGVAQQKPFEMDWVVEAVGGPEGIDVGFVEDKGCEIGGVEPNDFVQVSVVFYFLTVKGDAARKLDVAFCPMVIEENVAKVFHLGDVEFTREFRQEKGVPGLCVEGGAEPKEGKDKQVFH